MTTPTPAALQPEGVDRPATVAEQAAAALDVSDDILTVLEQLLERIDALEHPASRSPGTENRAEFRFEHYPPADTEADEHAQFATVRAAWERLDAWVDWLVATYKLTSVIPPCWPEHPAVREELMGLRIAWIGAWFDQTSTDAVVVFHERLAGARNRLLDSNWGNPRCPGTHDADSGLELAEQYRSWTIHPNHHRALIAARDRALALVNRSTHTSGGDLS